MVAVIDVTDATFNTEVVERSKQVPVVVDLWAEWCGPCRTLGPILEQVIAGTQGKVVGVKIDIDKNPQVAQAFRVQSIPFVVALRDGQVVDSFLGAKPEHEVRAFVESLVTSPADERLAAIIASGDEAALRAALAEESANEVLIVALARILAGDGRGEEALELLAKVPETPETRHLAALARHGGEVSDEVEGKLDALLERVKGDDEARQEFVDLLELLGPDDPRTATYRRALASRLY